MGSYAEDWGDLSWTADPLITGAVIATGAGQAGTAVSSSGALDTEISVEVAYGSPASADVVLYFLRETGGSSNGGYEDINTAAGYAVPGAASSTRARTFTVPASFGRWKPFVQNPSGASVTVTVRTRQSTGVTA